MKFYLYSNKKFQNVLRFKEKNILKPFKSKFQTENFPQIIFIVRIKAFLKAPNTFHLIKRRIRYLCHPQSVPSHSTLIIPHQIHSKIARSAPISPFSQSLSQCSARGERDCPISLNFPKATSKSAQSGKRARPRQAFIFA